jgi:hypothetical protein
MAKEIRVNSYRTGRIDRYGFYDDLRGAACAWGLLAKAGWEVRPIKHLKQVDRYYVRSVIKRSQA